MVIILFINLLVFMSTENKVRLVSLTTGTFTLALENIPNKGAVK